ncbi:DUF2897 family protein [Bowmanella dokdonensis]|uniref:DUF2897 family protein n=1 Tax=Bowmanella dokdonensis TaxID=751969 RepID=A0A939DMN7_9ALTE|nr:DUF2897 family protein [Bowmanella dokdonensis]MBN7824591.1 DUF2897 family protein [Bowmanella dokdonensis]
MNWIIIGIVALALGLVVGNLMLLKHSANTKMPSLKDKKPGQDQGYDNENWDDDDY